MCLWGSASRCCVPIETLPVDFPFLCVSRLARVIAFPKDGSQRRTLSDSVSGTEFHRRFRMILAWWWIPLWHVVDFAEHSASPVAPAQAFTNREKWCKTKSATGICRLW